LPPPLIAKAILDHLEIKATPHGLEQVPHNGRYLFVSNHPMGGLDGLVLMYTLGTHFLSLKVILNDLLAHFKQFEEMIVPVNKHGRQNHEYAQTINHVFASDAQILNFPAGICSRKIKGEVTDLPWKRNFFQKAIKYQRDIVPVYFSGQNSNFFYRLANIRKKLHIPFNIEMLYLADELFRQKGAYFDLYFGPPISHTLLSHNNKPDEWLTHIRNQLYALPKTHSIL
jgi:putative hemolysin